jgi:hypothetical protein
MSCRDTYIDQEEHIKQHIPVSEAADSKISFPRLPDTLEYSRNGEYPVYSRGDKHPDQPTRKYDPNSTFKSFLPVIIGLFSGKWM